jgi:hypothetical protein
MVRSRSGDKEDRHLKPLALAETKDLLVANVSTMKLDDRAGNA